jgi:hypothetical protein
VLTTHKMLMASYDYTPFLFEFNVGCRTSDKLISNF